MSNHLIETITCERLRGELAAAAPLLVFEALCSGSLVKTPSTGPSPAEPPPKPLPEAHHAAGHIPGAIAMPLERVADVAKRFVTDLASPIVVYCASATCRNSHVAAEKLTALGYQSVRVFSGGKSAWTDGGLALDVSR